MLMTMLPTIEIQIHSAQTNPPLFKHVTLMVDGHDTRVSVTGKSGEKMYLYKLKKTGMY